MRYRIACHCEGPRPGGATKQSLWCPVLGYLILFFVCGLGFAADNAAVPGVAEEGLRDIKAPVYFPPGHFLWWLIFLALLIGGITAWVYFRKAKGRKIEEPPADTRSPWEIARDEFDALAGSGLLERREFKAYYSRLSDIVRKYFENRFRVRAPEMTTEEFLWSLEDSRDLTAGQKKALKNFLDSCDVVKFAKYVPRADEGKESFRLARELVEATK